MLLHTYLPIYKQKCNHVLKTMVMISTGFPILAIEYSTRSPVQLPFGDFGPRLSHQIYACRFLHSTTGVICIWQFTLTSTLQQWELRIWFEEFCSCWTTCPTPITTSSQSIDIQQDLNNICCSIHTPP